MRLSALTFRIGVPLALIAAPATAQDIIEYPTPEKYAEEAAQAEALPLFASEEPIQMTLLTDIKWLRDVRSDSTEADGTLTYMDLDGTMKETSVEVRTRGNWRRDKRNCNFPPLRLDFPKDDMDGTVFEDQDKLKLVTPCHDGRDSYQEYLLKEYLAYKTYNEITPNSFRVRLVEITYVDINDDYDSRTKIGFLIESDEHMSERNFATHEEVEQFHPGRMSGKHAVIASTFNYMIGFTDVSSVYGHNAKLIRTQDGEYIPVGYDFDFSGVVNARYATPDPRLPIRSVKERLYRGFCRPELQYEPISQTFLAAREGITEVVSNFTLLDEGKREDVLDFYEDFWEVMEDPGDFESKLIKRCLNW